MVVRIGINGFGRIGRLVVRGLSRHDGLELVHVNDLASDAATAAHLLEFDTVHGRYDGEVAVDGDTIVVEPFRARAFPVVKDLVVDRSSFDRIIESGGYISVNTGAASDANLTPVPKEAADTSFDAAACIGCGACVAACPNSAAQLFTSAKLAHLNLIPQGQSQRFERTETMVDTMVTFFGSCTNHGECHEACPKEISLDFIAFMNRDYVKAKMKNRKLAGQS